MRTIKKRHIENVRKHIGTEPITLRTLARRMRCSYYAAQRRMAAFLEAEGLSVGQTVVREGERGPASVAYYLTR